MLHTLFIQGEEARWETFKRAGQEAQRRAALRDDVGGGRRLRNLSLRRRNLAKDTARGQRTRPEAPHWPNAVMQ